MHNPVYVNLYNTPKNIEYFSCHTGPITGMLCDKYGVRRIVIAGALLACVGWTSSAFANGLVYLYFSLGIVAGMQQLSMSVLSTENN